MSDMADPDARRVPHAIRSATGSIEGETDHAGTHCRRRSHMLKNLIKLLKDEEGATALEYGLMAAAVAGVLIVVAYFLGNRVGNTINNVAIHM
jgi:pilus assembly protein Flp/PilA